MTWVSGFPAACLACGAAAGTLQVIDEWFDLMDKVWVGTAECPECHERSGYTRRATTKTRRPRRRRPQQLALPFGETVLTDG